MERYDVVLPDTRRYSCVPDSFSDNGDTVSITLATNEGVQACLASNGRGYIDNMTQSTTLGVDFPPNRGEHTNEAIFTKTIN